FRSLSTGTPGHRVGHQVDDVAEPFENRAAKLRYLEYDFLTFQFGLGAFDRYILKYFLERGTHRVQRRQLGRLLDKYLDEDGVNGVIQDRFFLGREVPEKRAGRHLGRGGDLLRGCFGISLLGEQTQRLFLDGLPGPNLLAFS